MKKNHLYKNKSFFLFAITFVFLFSFLSLFSFVNKAQALTLSPARIEISADPGQTLSEQMTLINENADTETFYSSYANFEAQGESGDPAFVQATDDLGTWMSTAPSITLTPGESTNVPFTITIPKDATPGGHFATIFWGTGPNKPGTVAVGAKTGLLVLLSVSGNVKQAAGFLNFNTINKQFWYSTLPVDFEYRFSNEGGDRIDPEGPITIRDTIFLPTQVLAANPGAGNVLPESTRRFEVSWVNYTRPSDYVTPTGAWNTFWSNVSYQWKNFAVGLYSAHLNVAYGINNMHAQSTVFFFVFPWQLVLVMLIIAFIVIWGGGMLIRRYNKFILDKAHKS